MRADVSFHRRTGATNLVNRSVLCARRRCLLYIAWFALRSLSMRQRRTSVSLHCFIHKYSINSMFTKDDCVDVCKFYGLVQIEGDRIVFPRTLLEMLANLKVNVGGFLMMLSL